MATRCSVTMNLETPPPSTAACSAIRRSAGCRDRWRAGTEFRCGMSPAGRRGSMPPVATTAGGSGCHRSRRFRRPGPLAVQVLRPSAAAVGEVLAMGDQALVQVAGKHRDAVGPGVVAEEVAGHTHLTAAAAELHRLIDRQGQSSIGSWQEGSRPAGGTGRMATTEAYARTSRCARDRARCAERRFVAGPSSGSNQQPTANSHHPGSGFSGWHPAQGLTRVRRCRTLALG
jgi:hypothetical protein